MKSVGIDIGTYSIKAVELESTPRGFRINRFAEQILGANPAFDPEIEIVEFLRSFSRTYDREATKFVFGLRQDRISVRNKIFPFSERQKILKSLPFELEEDLPFSNETAVFEAKIIKYMGNSAEVLAAATPKHRIEAALQLMKDSNIDVAILSAEGIAFANCTENWDAPIPRSQALPSLDDSSAIAERRLNLQVQIGHTRTLVLAYENNLLIGVRSIFWGGKNVADAIAKRYELPYVEALREMQTKAFILPSKDGASYDQIVFSDTISAQAKILANELQISMLEFKAEYHGVTERIDLSGGASNILNFHAYLTRQLEIPVNKLSVFNKFGNVQFEVTNKIDSVAGVALGLAIEGLKKPRNPAINFMRGEFAKQNTQFKLLWERWALTIQMTAALFVVFFVYAMFRETAALNLTERAQESLKKKAKDVAALPAKQANESGVKKYIRDQKNRSTEMKALENVAKMNSAMDILKRVTDSMPAKDRMKIDVRKFQVLDDTVQLEGVVADVNQFTMLEKSLGSIAIQGRVSRLPTDFTVQKPGVKFAFAFKTDRGVSRGQK
jgi:general secretion pathway protein L